MSVLSPLAGAALPPNDETLQDSVRASQQIFRVLLDALANPGTVHSLIAHPTATLDATSTLPIHAASVLVTLLDHEVSLHVEPSTGYNALRELVVRRTLVESAPVDEADVVVADANCDPTLPERLKRGSLEYPDDGATLILYGVTLGSSRGHAAELVLRGPGISDTRTLCLSGVITETLAARNRAVANYPTGIDLFLIDERGLVAGIPRTTEMRTSQEGPL